MMPTVRPGGAPHCRTCHAEPGGSLLSGKVLMTALHVVRALSGTLTPKAHLTFGCSLASWPCVYLDGVSWSLSRNLYQPVAGRGICRSKIPSSLLSNWSGKSEAFVMLGIECLFYPSVRSSFRTPACQPAPVEG